MSDMTPTPTPASASASHLLRIKSYIDRSDDAYLHRTVYAIATEDSNAERALVSNSTGATFVNLSWLEDATIERIAKFVDYSARLNKVLADEDTRRQDLVLDMSTRDAAAESSVKQTATAVPPRSATGVSFRSCSSPARIPVPASPSLVLARKASRSIAPSLERGLPKGVRP